MLTLEHSLVGLDSLDSVQGMIACGLGACERFLKTRLRRIEKVASNGSSFALKQVKDTNSLPLETAGG